MAVTRSDKYYFPHGDVIVQIEDVLFRIHRDMLNTHSGFFQDMFSTPTSDDTEGTSDEHPLHLPKDLCTAQSFTMLCKFLYPRELGVFPKIVIKELDVWEPVLKATTALQMDSARKYILSRLEDDLPYLSTEAARLLSIVMLYDETPEELALGCLRRLIYRRGPLTLHEAAVLGLDVTLKVMTARERLRILFHSPSLYESVPISDNCLDWQGSCQKEICQQIAHNLAEELTHESHRDDSDILDIIVNVPGCPPCSDEWDDLADTFKRERLDGEIRMCLVLLRHPQVC